MRTTTGHNTCTRSHGYSWRRRRRRRWMEESRERVLIYSTGWTGTQNSSVLAFWWPRGQIPWIWCPTLRWSGLNTPSTWPPRSFSSFFCPFSASRSRSGSALNPFSYLQMQWIVFDNGQLLFCFFELGSVKSFQTISWFYIIFENVTAWRSLDFRAYAYWIMVMDTMDINIIVQTYSKILSQRSWLVNSLDDNNNNNNNQVSSDVDRRPVKGPYKNL